MSVRFQSGTIWKISILIIRLSKANVGSNNGSINKKEDRPRRRTCTKVSWWIRCNNAKECNLWIASMNKDRNNNIVNLGNCHHKYRSSNVRDVYSRWTSISKISIKLKTTNNISERGQWANNKICNCRVNTIMRLPILCRIISKIRTYWDRWISSLIWQGKLIIAENKNYKVIKVIICEWQVIPSNFFCLNLIIYLKYLLWNTIYIHLSEIVKLFHETFDSVCFLNFYIVFCCVLFGRRWNYLYSPLIGFVLDFWFLLFRTLYFCN